VHLALSLLKINSFGLKLLQIHDQGFVILFLWLLLLRSEQFLADLFHLMDLLDDALETFLCGFGGDWLFMKGLVHVVEWI
jgi:hypothetical protein